MKNVNNMLSTSGLVRLLGLVGLVLLMVVFATQGFVLHAAAQPIVSGVRWNDTAANILSAHGGGMIKVGSTYYWIGQYMDDNHTIAASMGHNTVQFVAITCYSSTDLESSTNSHWQFVNNVLTQQTSGDLGPTNRIVERPHVIFNAATNLYVMWMHIDNNKYSEAKVGIATSPTVCGNYTYLGSFQPLNNLSRDESVFLDTDGNGYLISGDHLNIYLMNSSFTNVTSLVGTANPSSSSESPAMFKDSSTGNYFLLTSNKTWWSSNDNYYFTATNIAGPWTNRGDFTPGSNNTWNSQTSEVRPVTGSSTTTFMYMGDRWCENCWSQSYYVFLPLVVSGTSLTMNWYDQWTIDTATGTWAAAATTPTPVPTLQPPTATPGGSTVMHVNSMLTTDVNGTPKGTFGRPDTIYWRVQIFNQSGQPVSGASVTTQVFQPGGGAWVTRTATTDANGWAVANAPTVRASQAGTYTINVTGVTLTGATYDSASNVVSQITFVVQ